MIYLLWAMVALLFTKIKINKNSATIFLASILWLLMGLRSWELGLYDTIGIFYRDFELLSGTTLNEALHIQPFIKEPFMNIYTWFLNIVFNGNYQFFLIISSLITTISITRIVLKKTNQPIFGLFTYFSMFYFYQSFMIKQMIALAFVVYSLDYLNSRKFIQYCSLILVAGLFHKSAYVLLLLYPMCTILRFEKKYFMMLAIGIAIGIYEKQLILDFLYKLKWYNFSLYINEGIYSTEGSFNFSMIMFPALTFFCYCLRDLNNNIEVQNDYFIMMFIGCLLNCWSIVVTEFYRLSVYFLISLIIILPNSLERIPKKYRSISDLLIFLCLLIYAYKMAINTNCLPYYFFFE